MIVRLVLLAIILAFVACVLAVHLRGRKRLRFDRQLADHSALFAPYNLLMYAFSAVRARPILDRSRFPELDAIRDNWQVIRDEALALSGNERIRASDKHDDVSFASFFKQGWKRFYLKWYDAPPASALQLCPKTVALVNAVPGIKAAMFAMLAPHSRLNPHRDPFAGSLRYHLGLVTPNSRDCAIFVDGEEHAWGDGKDVVFDETYVHWVDNTTDQPRIIFFADIERPLKTGLMRAVNRRVSGFMGRMTKSPNNETGSEKTGAINRLYAFSQRNRNRSRAFKKRSPKMFRSLKYGAIVVALWVVLLAPWPLVTL